MADSIADLLVIASLATKTIAGYNLGAAQSGRPDHVIDGTNLPFAVLRLIASLASQRELAYAILAAVDPSRIRARATAPTPAGTTIRLGRWPLLGAPMRWN